MNVGTLANARARMKTANWSRGIGKWTMVRKMLVRDCLPVAEEDAGSRCLKADDLLRTWTTCLLLLPLKRPSIRPLKQRELRSGNVAVWVGPQDRLSACIGMKIR